MLEVDRSKVWSRSHSTRTCTCTEPVCTLGYSTNMVVQSAALTLFGGCFSIQLFSVIMCLASQCLPDIVYMCGTPHLNATADKVALVAPGRPPSCAKEAANCSTLITARPGKKIQVDLNTGISISPCDDRNFVQFSDWTKASGRYCQESPPPATAAATAGSNDLFTSDKNLMSVTYRSSGGDSFISIHIQVVGCPHDELIEGKNIQIQEEVFTRNGYSVNVTCEPGYLLSNYSASTLATCKFIASTKIYKWCISRRYQCRGVLCSSPPGIPNGWFTATDRSYTYLTSVTYACNSGYQLNGTSTRQCITQYGIGAAWSGAAPSCAAVDCGPPTICNANFSSPSNTSYGAEFQYTCNNSYVPFGLQIARCMENRRWNYVSCEDSYGQGIDASHSSQPPYTTIAATVGGVIAVIIITAMVAVLVIKKKRETKKKSQKPMLSARHNLDGQRIPIDFLNISAAAVGQRMQASAASSVYIQSGPYEELTGTVSSSQVPSDHYNTYNPMRVYSGEYHNLVCGSQNPVTDEHEYESMQ